MFSKEDSEIIHIENSISSPIPETKTFYALVRIKFNKNNVSIDIIIPK